MDNTKWKICSELTQKCNWHDLIEMFLKRLDEGEISTIYLWSEDGVMYLQQGGICELVFIESVMYSHMYYSAEYCLLNINDTLKFCEFCDIFSFIMHLLGESSCFCMTIYVYIDTLLKCLSAFVSQFVHVPTVYTGTDYRKWRRTNLRPIIIYYSPYSFIKKTKNYLRLTGFTESSAFVHHRTFQDI